MGINTWCSFLKCDNLQETGKHDETQRQTENTGSE